MRPLPVRLSCAALSPALRFPGFHPACWRVLGLGLLAVGALASGRAAEPAAADPAVLQVYRTKIEGELRGNILPFWLAHARDRKHAGFHNEITPDLVVLEDAPRGALLTSRILWTFSAAYRRYRDPAYLEMAQWARRDLVEHFRDEKFGGLYWSLTADGRPLDERKIVYGQVFGIYALSEYYRATGEQPALDQALELYRTVEARAHDRQHRGYREEFTRDWQLRSGRSAMGALGEKSQNAHIHILEAYTNLLRVWPDPQLKENLRDLIDVLLTKILDPSSHHLRLFLAADWTPRSDTISYGHDIEFSWLVVEAAGVLGDPAVLRRAEDAAVAIARVTAAEGVDTDGGVYNEGEAGRGLTDTRKEWWPQAEAAVGFAGAYRISGDEAHLRRALRSWDFIDTHLVDRRRGEWLRGVTREGRPLTRGANKVSFWKCPYHNSRACLELLDRLAPRTAAP